MTGFGRWKILVAVLIVGAAGVGALILMRPAAVMPPTAPDATADGSVLKFSVWGPPRAFTRGIEKIAEILRDASGGGVAIEVHYASALVPPKEQLEAIKLGLIEGAGMCVGYHAARMPLAHVLELPFLLTDDIEANAKIMDAVFAHPLIEKNLAEEWNTKYLMNGVLPRYEFMGNRRIARVEDMQGVRMRMSGANSLLLEEFHAVPTMVTAPETYTALERGTVDVVGFPWTYGFGSYRLFEVSKYVSDGIAMSGFACFFGIALDTWNALPEHLKAMLPRLRKEGQEAMIRGYEEADEQWLPIIRERLEIVPFPTMERDKMIAKSQAIWDKWAKNLDARGLAGTEILEFAKAQVAKNSP